MEDISTLGIKYSHIEIVIELLGGRPALSEKSSAEVCERILMPLTAVSGLSLCRQMCDSGLVDRANLFVSHVWDYKFLDVMDAIAKFVAFEYPGLPMQETEAVIWFDMFSVSQHQPHNNSFDWWKYLTMHVVSEMDNLLMITLPWDKPATLTLPRRIMELLACKISQCHFVISTTEAETERMTTKFLETGVDSYLMVQSEFDIYNSLVVDKDTDSLVEAVSKLLPDGFAVLDSMVLRAFDGWIVNCLKDKIVRSSNLVDLELLLCQLLMCQGRWQDAVTVAEKCFEDGSATSTLCTTQIESALGLAYVATGNYVGARPLLKHCYEVASQGLNKNSLATQEACNLAALHAALGGYADARNLYNSCLSPTKTQSERINILSGLAGVSHCEGQYRTAEMLYQECLNWSVQALGPNHPTTLNRLYKLAMLTVAYGKYDTAEPMFVQCLENRKRLLGSEHPETQITMTNFAMLCVAQGKYSFAGPILHQCVEVMKTLLGDKHPYTLDCEDNLGSYYRIQGNYTAADPIFRNCLESRQIMLGDRHLDSLRTVNNIGLLRMGQGRYKEAKSLFESSVFTSFDVFGQKHPVSLTFLRISGLFYKAGGEYSAAIDVLERCVDCMTSSLGREHPDTLSTLNDLAVVYYISGRYSEAKALFVASLGARRRLLGESHPDTLSSLNDFGAFCLAQKEFQVAEQCLGRCVLDRRSLLGPEHPDTLTALGNWASVLKFRGELDLAEETIRNCLAIRNRVLGDTHPDTLISMYELGHFYAEEGKYETSLKCLRHCETARSGVLGTSHPDTQLVVSELANVLLALGMYAESAPLLLRSLWSKYRLSGEKTISVIGKLAMVNEILHNYGDARNYYQQSKDWKENTLGLTHPDTLFDLNKLALMCSNLNDNETAECLLRQCLEIRRGVSGPMHPETLCVLSNLAFVVKCLNKVMEAELLYQDCLDARIEVLGLEEPDTLITKFQLALLKKSRGDYAAAEPLLRSCLDARERASGANHPDTLEIAVSLADIYRIQHKLDVAEPMLRTCLDISRRSVGSEHSTTKRIEYSLGLLYKELGYSNAPSAALQNRVDEVLVEVGAASVHSSKSIIDGVGSTANEELHRYETNRITFADLGAYVVNTSVDECSPQLKLRCRLYYPNYRQPSSDANPIHYSEHVRFHDAGHSLMIKRIQDGVPEAIWSCSSEQMTALPANGIPCYHVHSGSVNMERFECGQDLVEFKFCRYYSDSSRDVFFDTVQGIPFSTLTVSYDLISEDCDESTRSSFIDFVKRVAADFELGAILPVPAKFTFMAKVCNRNNFCKYYKGSCASNELAVYNAIKRASDLDCDIHTPACILCWRQYTWDMLRPAELAGDFKYGEPTFFQLLEITRKEFVECADAWIRIPGDDDLDF
jgi:tetratricopeptide (TPR) repeat protein